MDAQKYEYQSDFARRYIAQGREEGVKDGLAKGLAEGEAHGRVSLLMRQLTARFGPIDSQTRERIERASISDLDAIGERLLRARTLHEALGPA
jgi:flagellar biosynthesis/type III secretory pathway protein FliH